MDLGLSATKCLDLLWVEGSKSSVLVDRCVLGQGEIVIDLDDFAILEVLVLPDVVAEDVRADIRIEWLGLVDSRKGELVSADEDLHCGYVLLFGEDDFCRDFGVHPSSYIAGYRNDYKDQNADKYCSLHTKSLVVAFVQLLLLLLLFVVS